MQLPSGLLIGDRPNRYIWEFTTTKTSISIDVSATSPDVYWFEWSLDTPTLSRVVADGSLQTNARTTSGGTCDIKFYITNPSSLLQYRMFTSSTTFSGKLPRLGAYKNLLVFYMYGSSGITGTIPDLSNLTSLIDFRVSGKFTSPYGALTGSIPDLSANVGLVTFYCRYNPNMSGSIPDLSANTYLVNFYCTFCGLSGSIPDLSANTYLVNFYCDENNLSGSIPDLSANIHLKMFLCGSNSLSGSIPSLTANTILEDFQCFINNLSGSIPDLSSNTALLDFDCHTNSITGVIPSLTANTVLQDFDCHGNGLTDYTASTISSAQVYFDASSNVLPASAVNQILADFMASVTLTPRTGELKLGGTGNAAPTGQGLIDKASLITAGWTVSTNT
jgi:hypothetical protein